MPTRWSLLFHPAVNLALGPVSFSPVKMWDPGLWGLQRHADQGCYMHVMFSHGSCVWVRRLAGQLDKQRCTLSCYDVICAEPKTVSSFVFMLAWAVSSMPCFITALVFSSEYWHYNSVQLFLLEFYLQKCVRYHDSACTIERTQSLLTDWLHFPINLWWKQLYITWQIPSVTTRQEP